MYLIGSYISPYLVRIRFSCVEDHLYLYLIESHISPTGVKTSCVWIFYIYLIGSCISPNSVRVRSSYVGRLFVLVFDGILHFSDGDKS